MKKSCPSIVVGLLYLTFTDTLMLPETSVTLLETVSARIIERYSPIMYDVQMAREKAGVLDAILKTITVPIQLSEPNLHENSFLFFIPRSQAFASSVLEMVSNFTKSKYVVFIDCEECVTITWILEKCWHHKLLNVAVIPIRNDTAFIYTYFPFRNGACFDPSPVLIDTFTSSSVFNVELFPARKVWNVQNCPVKVSTFDLYPGIYFDKREMKGLYSPVFNAVAGAMNFSPEFVFTDGWFGSASAPKKTGIRGDVFAQRAHLGFSFFMPLDFTFIDYDSLAMTGCVTWCLPAAFKKKSPLWFLVGEFTPSVWLMLFLSAVAMVGIDLVAQKFHWSAGKDVIYLSVWAALLQVSGKIPEYSSVSVRAVWISWLMSSLVLSTAYLSMLKSFRTAPYIEYSVKNLEDLADSGYQAWYHKSFAELVDEVSKSNHAIAKLKSKSFAFPTAMFGTMVELFRYRNITGLMSDKLCRTYSGIYEDEFELYPVPEACMQVTSYHFFVLGKKSFFTEPVTILMSRLNQAGIVQKSFSENRTFSRGTDVRQRKISLRTMRPVLLLLGCGLTVSSIVLVLEWMFSIYK